MHRRKAAMAGAALALVVSLVGGTAAQAATPGELPGGLVGVHLLNINDFHGRIDDKGALACTVENAKAELGEGATLFLSAGDNIGATPFVSSSAQDEPTIAYLSALQLAASAVGNHEFDRGYSDLTRRVAPSAVWTYLGANVYHRGTSDPALPEYSLHQVNGLKVAVIGAVTQETPTLVSPLGVSGLDFGDPIAAVNRVADRLKDGDVLNGEADIVIAEYHNGANASGALDDAMATPAFADMATKTSPKVDVIFNGHTHQAYAVDAPIPGGVGTRPIVQASSYGTALAQVSLGYDTTLRRVTHYNAKIVKPSVPAAGDRCLTDPQYRAARAVAEAAIEHARVAGSQPVGRITADITTAMQDAEPSVGRYSGTVRDDRTRESALGNLSAQIWLEAMNEPGRPGADIGIMNAGGLRSDLRYQANPEQPGDGDGVVTLAEAASVHPFANTLQTVEITGAQLKTLLEQQWQPEGTSRPFVKLGLSYNVRYTYDPSRPAGERILEVTINDRPLDFLATYRVAAGAFLVAGGDNFTVLRDGKNVKDAGLIDTDAFINYFKRQQVVLPSQAKHSVAVRSVVVTRPGKGAPNNSPIKSVAFTVEGTDLTSHGAPANTTARVTYQGRTIGTATVTTARVDDGLLPVRDGVIEYSADVEGGPKPRPGDRISLILSPSGTVVTFTVAGR